MNICQIYMLDRSCCLPSFFASFGFVAAEILFVDMYISVICFRQRADYTPLLLLHSWEIFLLIVWSPCALSFELAWITAAHLYFVSTSVVGKLRRRISPFLCVWLRLQINLILPSPSLSATLPSEGRCPAM